MGNKQKIAFLCHPYHRGGVTRWMADAAIALSNTGHEVYFVTVEPVVHFYASEGRETLLQLLAKEPNHIHVVKAKAGREFEFGSLEYRTYVYKKLLAAVPLGTPVILSDAPAVWESATSLHNSYPVVGVLHGDDEYYYDHAEKYFGYVDLFVCVSGRISKNTRKRIPGFDSTRVFTIPCGINLPADSSNTSTGEALRLIYVGRISDFAKRTGDLLKIAALLVERNVKFHLNIVGDGDAKTALENKFNESGMLAHATFTGWLSKEEVVRYLHESDILILPSDFEGTSIAMMEAFAAGCGVVGTRVSGIEDYEYDPNATDCLSVYTIGDIEEAVGKIVRLAAVPAGIRHDAARKLAETEFSLQVCLEKYLTAIATLKMRDAMRVEIKISLLSRLYSNTLAIARSIKVRLIRKQ